MNECTGIQMIVEVRNKRVALCALAGNGADDYYKECDADSANFTVRPLVE